MPVVPTKIPEKIAWYQTREAAWTTNAVAIGITSAEMTTMSARILAASGALAAHNAAQAAAKDATVALHEAARLMSLYGADLIKKIRAKAGQVGGDSVYVLASVPPPAIPSPVGPPGECTGLKVALQVNGSLELSWKCANPPGASGTLYQVFRSENPAGPFTYLGGSGERKFLDATIPAGTSNVTYQIQAVRSTAVGPWAQFNVNFGVSGVVSVTAQPVTKAAA